MGLAAFPDRVLSRLAGGSRMDMIQLCSDCWVLSRLKGEIIEADIVSKGLCERKTTHGSDRIDRPILTGAQG